MGIEKYILPEGCTVLYSPISTGMDLTDLGLF